MENAIYEVESFKRFSESLIWKLNRDYYQKAGIEAWSNDVVPHHLTSNSMVGKTYAELLFSFLKDLASKDAVTETVYILELGAGHGRLAFHILKHLEILSSRLDITLPPFCYVLSDIVENNLLFFKNHPQLQIYFHRGQLDIANYDAIDGKVLHLQYSNRNIKAGNLNQPIIALANYFFDSIPNDLFHIKDGKISLCSIALNSSLDPKLLDTHLLNENLQLTYDEKSQQAPYFTSAILNEILEEYKTIISDSYLFFPNKSIQCLSNLKALSKQGLMLLTIDKGYHDLADLDNKDQPEIITHGSFSLWVNYHALGSYCQKSGGKALFPAFSTFHLQVGCLLFLEEAERFQATNEAFQRCVNDFGPDDFNSIKQLTYGNMSILSLTHMIAILRLSAYDSTIFLKMLPRIKEVVKELTLAESKRLVQTMELVWNFYFNINEPHDLANSLAGIFFDMGLYHHALKYFQHSTEHFGLEADTCYNKILCYYQLRQDTHFANALEEAEGLFPDSEIFKNLHNLDLKAV